MTEFQSMVIKRYDVYVYRDSKRIEISTEDLLPWDLVSVTRTDKEPATPYDLVLVDGE